VQEFRLLGVGLQQPQSEFENLSRLMKFFVDKEALEQFFGRYFSFPYQFSIHMMILAHHASSGAGIVSQILVGVPSGLSLATH
jgi:hypothetical protein